MQRRILSALTSFCPVVSGVQIFITELFGMMVHCLKKEFRRMTYSLKILHQSEKKYWVKTSRQLQIECLWIPLCPLYGRSCSSRIIQGRGEMAFVKRYPGIHLSPFGLPWCPSHTALMYPASRCRTKWGWISGDGTSKTAGFGGQKAQLVLTENITVISKAF